MLNPEGSAMRMIEDELGLSEEELWNLVFCGDPAGEEKEKEEIHDDA